jgi:hypothetical protein
MTAQIWADVCLTIVAIGGLLVVCAELHGLFCKVRIDDRQ